MLTKGAIGNLVNRYKAVLKKCNLINTFGSLAVASMLVLGGAGVAGAKALPGGDAVIESGDYTVTEDTTIDGAAKTMVGKVKAGSTVVTIDVAEGSTLSITSNGGSDNCNGVIAYTNITGKGDIVLHAKGSFPASGLGQESVDSITANSISITSDNGYGIYSTTAGESHTLNAKTITITSKEHAVMANSSSVEMTGFDSLTMKVTSEGSGVFSGDGSNVNLEGGSVTVEANQRSAFAASAGGTLTITADSIVASSKALVGGEARKSAIIAAQGGDASSIELDVKNSLTVSGDGSESCAIKAATGGVSIKGTANITINGNVHGDAAAGKSAKVDIKGNNITIASASGTGQSESTDGVIRNVAIDASGKVTIEATGNLSGVGAGPDDTTRPHTENSIKAKEIEISSANSFGVYANNHSYYASGERNHCMLDADIINITSKKDGILVMNGAEAAITGFSSLNITSEEQGIGSEFGGLTIEGGHLIVDAAEEGIRSKLGGDLDITTELLKVEAGEGFESIKLTGDSDLRIESGTTQLDGDITTETYVDPEGGIHNAHLQVNFDSEDSYLNGNVTTVEGAFTKLDFNGGTWNTSAGVSTVSELSLNGANVNVAAGADILAEKTTGNGNINIQAADESGTALGEETLGSFIAGSESEASLNVQATDADGNVMNADQVSTARLSELQQQVKIVNEEGEEVVLDTTASATDGIVNAGFTMDANGNITSGGGASSVTKAVLEAASVNTVALDKILTNDVRKRLGDIRSDKNTTGVWMRWDGGKLKGNGLTNDFNTIQIGGDTKVGKNCRLGVAGSFTHGDTEFDRGNGQLEGFSFAAYSTWMGENGMFADVVARLGHFSTEMNVEGRKGDMDNRVFSLSGEYGWRLNVCEQFFVEPQVELAYTYVNSSDLELGDARFSFDNVDSLTGRLGLVAGWNLPNDRGNVYARASVLQQFMGDAKVTGYSGVEPTVHKTDGDDTWLEYGIGANVKLTDKTYIWADVERTEGANIDEEWRGTVGIRYSF